MSNRLDLQAKFEAILGSRNVYFQPPESVKIKYPAIVYKRKPIDTVHADNRIYIHRNSYEVVLIDKNPESVYAAKILELPYCEHIQHYPADNLNHDVFVIYI